MANNIFRKSLVIGIIILFVGASIIPSVGSISQKKQSSTENKTFFRSFNFRGNTLYVGGSEPGNYSSIQDAIDNASDGDTVYVYDDSSPYYEKVFVDKSINLVGEDRDTTVIDGGKSSDVVFLSNDGIILTGFIIKNGSSDNAGLRIQSNDNIIGYNNILDNEGYGIFIWEGNGNEIKYCEIINNNNVGIYLDRDSGFNEIHNCTINGNFYGIEFGPNGKNEKNSIRHNTIIDNGNIGIWLRGDDIDEDDTDDVIEGNIIRDHGNRGIDVSVSDCDIIKNKEIENNGEYGIRVANGRGCIISENEHIKNHKIGGILIYHADNNRVICNKIMSSSYGIQVISGNDNTIWGNTIKWSDTFSIYLTQGSRRNKIMKNNFLDYLPGGEHAIFYDSFNTHWWQNFWDLSEGGFLRLRPIWGFRGNRPVVNYDWFPSKYEWENICPPNNIKSRQYSTMWLLQTLLQRFGLQ